MRRTIKPFTVEVRSAGRTTAVRSFDAQPHVPELVEQPAERQQKPVEAAAIVSTGRILPALDKPAAAPAPAPREKRPYTRRPKVVDVPMFAGVAIGAKAPVAPEIRPAPVAVRVEPFEAPAPAEVAEPAAWRRLPRRPRSAYPLGEKWKARLPVSRFEMDEGE